MTAIRGVCPIARGYCEVAPPSKKKPRLCGAGRGEMEKACCWEGRTTRRWPQAIARWLARATLSLPRSFRPAPQP